MTRRVDAQQRPLSFIFYLLSYILYLNYLSTNTDPSRLAFSRRSLVPLGTKADIIM